MDVTPIMPVGRHLIEAYGGGTFRVAGRVWRGPLLVFPGHAETWDFTDFAALAPASLAPVLAQEPKVEILLVGTGTRMQLLPPGLRKTLRTAGVAVEAMDTGAACRTYNVLMAEARRVAAALVPV